VPVWQPYAGVEFILPVRVYEIGYRFKTTLVLFTTNSVKMNSRALEGSCKGEAGLLTLRKSFQYANNLKNVCNAAVNA
jgi:hypothetical protein